MSIKPYPKYKESGVEWLGMVPEGWRVEPFKWQIERNDGGVWGDDPNGQNDTIVLRSTEQTVDGNWKIEDPAPRKLAKSEIDAALLVTDDLLVTKSSGSSLHIGKTTLVNPEIAKMRCCYSNFMQRIRTKASFLPKLAWHVLNNELARRQFGLLSNSTIGLANLNGTMIGQILVPVPTFSEQSAIASFLDHETSKIDALIAEQEKLIELLKEKRSAVISHAVTKGLNPDVKMKDSGVEWLGMVPEHWIVKPLTAVASFSGGGTPSRDNLEYWNGVIPWVSPKDMKMERIVGAEESITEAGLSSSAASMVPIGAILMVVRSGILKHTIPVAINEVPVALNQDMKALRLDLKQCTAVFFLRLVQGLNERLLLLWSKQGATVESIEHDYLAKTRISLPPLSEQSAIASFLDHETAKIDSLTTEAQQGINLLQERRSALISAAVTGQIDVRDFNPSKAA